MFLGVSDAFCWLSNIYIFDKLLNVAMISPHDGGTHLELGVEGLSY